MQRTLPFAIVLLIAALAGGLWWFLLANEVAPSVPSPPASEAPSGKADAEVGNLESAESKPPPIERSVAGTSTPTEASGHSATKAVLRVHVVWADDAPAAGVLVTLRWNTREHAYAVHDQIVSDENGQATFAGVMPGKWSLRSDRGDRESLEVEPGEHDVRFKLRPGVSVEGIVVNSQQLAIGNACVWLQTRSPDWSGGSVVTTSDSHGRFRLHHIPPDVSLGAFARNHTRSDLVDLDVIDTSTPPAKVTLMLRDQGGQLTGIVRSTAGEPIANALIGVGKQTGSLDTRGNRVIEKWSIRSTKTDVDGRFAIDGLLPGSTTVAVRAKGFGFWRSAWEIVDQQETELAIEMDRSGTVHGLIKNGDGEPFAGAIVRCYDQAPRTPFIAGGQIDFDETFGYLATTADENGAYELADVSAGTAHLFAQKGGRFRMGEPVPYATTELEMPPAGKVEWNPTVSNGRTIEGIVFYKDGHPMPNRFVTLIDQKTGKQHVSTNNAKGLFLFANLDDIPYDVHVQVWDGPEGAPAVECSGVVPNTGRVELRATWDKPVKKPTGGVIGRVDDQGSRVGNMNNAYVVLSSEDRWFREGDKLVNGSFAFKDVTPGRFRLVLMEGGSVLAESDWHELLPGARLDTGVLQTKPGGSVRIHVTRRPGAESCTPKLYFRQAEASRSSSVDLGTHNEVLVKSLSPGTYTVTGNAKGMTRINATATVTVGATSDLHVTIDVGVLARLEAWLPQNSTATSYTYTVTRDTGEHMRTLKGKYGARSLRPHAMPITLPKGTYTVDYEAIGELVGKETFTIDGTSPEQKVRINLRPK